VILIKLAYTKRILDLCPGVCHLISILILDREFIFLKIIRIYKNDKENIEQVFWKKRKEKSASN
jgi:hypothetical protein